MLCYKSGRKKGGDLVGDNSKSERIPLIPRHLSCMTPKFGDQITISMQIR